MGLFDRFRKRVTEVAEQTDADALSADAESAEARAALAEAQSHAEPIPQIHSKLVEQPTESEEEWEDLEEPAEPAQAEQDEWDDWDEEEEIALPQEMSRRERKLLEKAKKAETKRERQQKKELKKRGAIEMARPKGSKVDLSMMRTTTGRQLILSLIHI